MTAAAQRPSAEPDSVLRRLERAERQLDSLRAELERQTQQLIELDERSATPPAGADRGPRTLASGRGIYGKPFVGRLGGRTALGGYVDLEYSNDLDGHESSFDQHRLIPFLFAEITHQLHFGTELEFEHGGEEVSVEFATLDYRFSEALNLRAGIVLSPLGRFNLVHDSPVNDLTDRPLVDQQLIPTTLSESGAGVFGTIYPSERSLLTYEAYVVNGFGAELLAEDGSGTVTAIRTRPGRGSKEEDANFAKSVVGRVAFSPLFGVEVGASAHSGRFAPDDAGGGDRLTITALDATVQRGPVEVLGEYARAAVTLPAGVGSAVATRQDGWYLQGNLHFGHGWLPPRASSVFTAVARMDRVDFQRGVDGDLAERLTIGLNWRPVEDAVLKTDLQWNWRTPPGSTARGDAERRLLVSLASYF